MNNLKKIFKSIFVTSNIFKENEEHANNVTALTMLNLFWIFLIIWILTYFNVFKVEMSIMNAMLLRCILLLVVPAIICYVIKGKGKWIKHLLFSCFVIMVAMADATLKYNVTLIMVIPIILAARYYNKSFTFWVAVATTGAFAISAWMSTMLGQQDINTYNLIIPEGTTITVNSTLRDAVTKIKVDEGQRLRNIFIHFFLPKMFVYNIIAFACVQVSQSGKKMIEKQTEISNKNSAIKTELKVANEIQKNFLPAVFPPFPEHREIDIYASMQPAKEVGGDFYDMFLIDDNHLAILVADVSGKGIPASLVMMISKILIKNVTLIDMEVNKALTRVNKMLCDGNKLNIFVTCWFGILDLTNGKLNFANAGHNPPLIYSNKTRKFEYLRIKPNMVLAGLEKTEYLKNEIQLEPGDKIFLYTDGVTEATNIKDELYGEERLQNFLNDNSDLNVVDTLKNLKNDIDKFVGKAEQFDDITMLELFYKDRKDENVTAVCKKFEANKSELSKVQNFVESELTKYNCDKNIIMKIIVAIEEIFVNIANYAYKDEKGECTLIIEYDKRGKVNFIFEDSGIQFNPLEQREPDITLPANKRNIGGLGILITKKTMDDIEYKYENNKNILIVAKNI